MGCNASMDDDAPIEKGGEEITPKRGGSYVDDSSEMTKEHHMEMHRRLAKLMKLDDATKIPFILVELRGMGDQDGFIEVCGKDEYGIYDALDDFFRSVWRCKKMDAGSLAVDTPLPFSDATYRWPGYRAEGDTGLSNMGLATMQLVEFMCNEHCWTLGVVNGGNVGMKGEIREQQLIFKAPHPMNMVAEHVMVELRSAGYMEVCGSNRRCMDRLHTYFVEELGATPVPGHEEFSDRYYSCKSLFKERGKSGENNMGQVTVQICDSVVKNLQGFSLVTMNGGNYGEDGSHREQQLVFRWDNHPLGQAPHLMVELREAGFIEICGVDHEGIHSQLSNWLSENWGCKETKSSTQQPFCDKKLTWKYKDMTIASAELTAFFHHIGWSMMICSQGTVKIKSDPNSREQQILFRPGASGHGEIEPHLFIELYTGEGKQDLYMCPNKTQVLAKQYVRIKEVGDCTHAREKFCEFMTEYLGGSPMEDSECTGFHVDCFLARGLTDNNLGYLTMRICDFMVDALGWSFVVCNVCNLGDGGLFREQQMVFRWDGERREIPPVRDNNGVIDWVKFPGLKFPSYWQSKKVLSLRKAVETVSCQPEEIEALQEIFDKTFKRVLTRDRVYEYQLGVSEEMPFRLEVVHAFRSEHAELYRRFMERRAGYSGGEQYRPKTLEGGAFLNKRLMPGEALLAHGTNPSSAMGILKTGFSLSAAGKSTGTMFGYGIYLAECVSKSDEYARDDNGGTYPGLMAMLMCRALVGKPYVVTEAGDSIDAAKAAGCDCVCGDREQKVGTYKEYIFFDERSVVPEYAVIYKRQYDRNAVPVEMRQDAKGVTGRNWQVRLEGGWTNFPPDVSHELNQLEKSGGMTYDRVIGNIMYHFDLSDMTQKNTQSDKSRKIRPPMRR